MTGQTRHLVKAFPIDLAEDVYPILDLLPANSRLSFSDGVELRLAGETLLIPYRIYYDELDSSEVQSLTADERIILRTLYTRHHNGYVRENNLQLVITYAAEHQWITPYLMLLIGEYVERILQVIYDNRSLLNDDFIKTFIIENPTYYRTLQHRVMSYWNCYYRRKYPTRDNYVGFQLLDYIVRLPG